MIEHRNFTDATREGFLVLDGAMGTELYRRHVFTNRCFDELCLSDPRLIHSIHQDYCDAGADVLLTNTFGANRPALAQYGLGDRLADIHKAAVALAREVAGSADRRVFVGGSIGPLPPGGRAAPEELHGLLAEQVEALRSAGADFIMFETLPNREAVEHAAAAMTGFAGMPFVLSFAVVGNCETQSGETIDRMLAPLPEGSPAPVAWGMNCGAGPEGLLDAVERAVRLTRLPLWVKPNAGHPREVGGRMIYFCSPEYLAEYAKRYVSLGAAAVGGCCGTTPEHIREIAQTVKPLSRTRSRAAVIQAAQVEQKEPVPFAQRSEFARKLAERRPVATVELVPPRGYDLAGLVAKSRQLREQGIDAVNIPDGPRASSRISPLVAAAQVLAEAGIEPILHFCCRDRNLIGMQADLLGCAACGVRNLLFVTGDPPKVGNYPFASGVFDTDSIGMVAVQARLNRGVDLGGQAIDPPTAAVIGVGLDPTSLDRANELKRFAEKVEAGAEFAITQPVFDPGALLAMLDEVERHGIPILAGIWPLASYRNALFMHNEVPGVEIPAHILERMASRESREDQLKEGVDIARESVACIASRVAGIQVSAPFGKIDLACAVIA
ncbi:MAG: bifunctional homocysteine S-methyltransferase/methylenetetrahydrofolate reductase [Thermoguttaceae bacterium]|nr:bifunctional homocysteine S-methyltransferase/methylenetetrahydrofolate reductase [Thermoguttaceae bacterium]